MSRYLVTEHEKIDAALVRLIVEYARKNDCGHDAPLVTMFGMQVCLECLRLAAP